MKKIHIRSFAWLALTTASLLSYVYLSAISPADSSISVSDKVEVREGMEEGKKDSKVFLPDVALVKRIINITKIVLPRD